MNMSKRLIGHALILLLCVVAALSLFMSAALAEEIAYVNAAGEDMGTKPCTHVTGHDTEWSEGWYALTTTFYINNPIHVNGTVNLILCGNYTLIAEKGIILNPGSQLII